VDTTFLDTAYNQFAGLPRIYFKDTPATVYTCVFKATAMCDCRLIQPGGRGQADKRVRDTVDTERGIINSFNDPNLWVSQSG